MTRSSFRASCEVKFCQVLKPNTPLQRLCNTLRMACLRESNKKWPRDDRSNLADASTSRSIGRNPGGASQSEGCSVAIVLHNDFDCVHEVASTNLAIDSRMSGIRSSDQEQQAFVQKSPGSTRPHSKRYNFTIKHAFATQFLR